MNQKIWVLALMEIEMGVSEIEMGVSEIEMGVREIEMIGCLRILKWGVSGN